MSLKPLILTLAGACFALALSTAIASAAPDIGKPAPDFTGTDTHGAKHSLHDLRGKTVILEWTNDGCPYVKKHYGSGNMQSLQKDMTEKGIVWLTIASSAPGEQGHLSPAEHDALMKQRGASPTAVIMDEDGAIGHEYGAQTTPHIFIITPDGNLAYKGAIDDKATTNPDDIKGAHNYVRSAIEQLTAGKTVDPAVTKSYGCSVKYKS